MKLSNSQYLFFFMIFVILTINACQYLRLNTNDSGILTPTYIKFIEYKEKFGFEKIDSIKVLDCIVGGDCGSQATATSIVALWKLDTIQIFEICGKIKYHKFQTYKLIQDSIDWNNFNYECMVNFNKGDIEKNRKWYFGNLKESPAKKKNP